VLLGFGLDCEWGSWILHSVFGDADLDVNYGSVEELGAALIFEPQPPLNPAKHTDCQRNNQQSLKITVLDG